jgi:bacterioferritin (cytochrome b1)
MLLTREEMTFPFAGAQLSPARDRELLEWMFNQFLYGEVTGIQVGHWLYDAPDFEAAKFLARQSLEEMQHVDNFLRIMAMLGCRPKPAHAAVRFLATGMMGGSWAEHVALEMAQGEGFVLQAFYAVIDTLDHKPSVDILRRAVKQEERHVEFGEQQTAKAIEGKPWLRRRLLGLSLVSMWGVRRLARYMERRLPKDHGVMKHLAAFLDHANVCAELGLVARPLGRRGLRRQAARRRGLAGDATAPRPAAVAQEEAADRYLPGRRAHHGVRAAGGCAAGRGPAPGVTVPSPQSSASGLADTSAVPNTCCVRSSSVIGWDS